MPSQPLLRSACRPMSAHVSCYESFGTELHGCTYPSTEGRRCRLSGEDNDPNPVISVEEIVGFDQVTVQGDSESVAPVRGLASYRSRIDPDILTLWSGTKL